MDKTLNHQETSAPAERFIVNVSGQPKALRELNDADLMKLATDASTQLNQLSQQMQQIDANRLVAVQMAALASFEIERRGKSIQIAHALPH